jgi:hypothetical protein
MQKILHNFSVIIKQQQQMSVYLRTEDLSEYARNMAFISDKFGVVSKLTQIADRLDEQNERIKRLEQSVDLAKAALDNI